MLRKIRITLATIFFIAITMLFLDFTGIAHEWCGWMAEIQFLPALLALNIGIIALIILFTLLFGRIYCSVICPLGIFQDIISWISSKRRKKKARFSYSLEKRWWRYITLVLFFVAIIGGFTAIASIIAPYSTYGRIASTLFTPVYQWGNNLLAYFAERVNNYTFYRVDVWVKSITTLVIASISVIVLIILAWRNGRTYCNTICPVGTILGFLSKYSLFRPVIDTTKCNGCSLCSRKCKASCIDSKNHAIDYSRCVACMDCIDNCRQGAIKYSYRRQKSGAKENTTNDNRRTFLSISTIIATTFLVDAQKRRRRKRKNKVDGGLAIILDKKIPTRNTPIVPAGAISQKHLSQHCTTCQLCISACPNQVLRPSGDLATLMQPEMSYERGYCRPECTRCADVCPSNAINPISAEEKSSIQIGHAVWIKENCISFAEGVKCGNCARHCPTGAIMMVEQKDKPDAPKIPVVNTERCIGCGACENLCPVRPFSAIYVEGNKVHHTI
ncbi:MAG: 4Fe-4S dicluster domain-containing protein [Muribaculaceae bacterium]|nr:4Fe-4S dicluster domain-containing protein [Muribaculaceae bacterium]